jgi:hypothetical protein
MKRLVLLLVFLPACAGWQTKAETALGKTHQAAKAISTVVEPILRTKCVKIAKDCADNNDTICNPLTDCQADRHKINDAIKTIHIAVAAGKTFVALGDEKKGLDMVAKALAELAKVQTLAAKHGLMP